MEVTMTSEDKVKLLREKGVNIPVPGSVEIGCEVDTSRISGENVTIHSGCRIFGEKTFIAKGCVIGREGPATIDNCLIGPEVSIKGGFVNGAVFLEKASVGYGSHIREGCIFEEEASVAHCVGLKQTLLFPFVTLGSLINFCDCLMAGGTSRKDHSEVGSSYIHFNFTPNQDKATPSLLGDVPRGVMLNNKPIFLGGQGGLVGPVSLNYGTVVAAGTIQRLDEDKEDRLLFGGGLKAGNIKFTPGIYQNVGRIIKHNITYIANLIALMEWYTYVRSRFVSNQFPEELMNGLKSTLDLGIHERMKRLIGLFEKLENTSSWNHLVQCAQPLQQAVDRMKSTDLFPFKRQIFIDDLDQILSISENPNYIFVIKNLNSNQISEGMDWLNAVVAGAYESLIAEIPGM